MSILTLRMWYKVHKWTAIVAGLALVMWLITGMLMSWDRMFPESSAPVSKYSEYYSDTLSPAEAVVRVENISGETLDIDWIDLRSIGDTLIYDVWTKGGQNYMVEAHNGQELKIGPELAKQLAIEKYSIDDSLEQADLIVDHSPEYPYGPVPVYRFVLDDIWGTHIYVNVATNSQWGWQAGGVWQNTRWARVRDLLSSLHTFDTLRIITDKGRLITLLLWIATFATLFVAVVGYYLALPRRWQLLTRSGQKKKSNDGN